MGLIESLRKAEEQGRDLARKGMDKARDAFGDTESRLRRKMRVRPGGENRTRKGAPLSTPVRPAATSGTAAEESLANQASEEDAA